MKKGDWVYSHRYDMGGLIFTRPKSGVGWSVVLLDGRLTASDGPDLLRLTTPPMVEFNANGTRVRGVPQRSAMPPEGEWGILVGSVFVPLPQELGSSDLRVAYTMPDAVCGNP